MEGGRCGLSEPQGGVQPPSTPGAPGAGREREDSCGLDRAVGQGSRSGVGGLDVGLRGKSLCLQGAVALHTVALVAHSFPRRLGGF